MSLLCKIYICNFLSATLILQTILQELQDKKPEKTPYLNTFHTVIKSPKAFKYKVTMCWKYVEREGFFLVFPQLLNVKHVQTLFCLNILLIDICIWYNFLVEIFFCILSIIMFFLLFWYFFPFYLFIYRHVANYRDFLRFYRILWDLVLSIYIANSIKICFTNIRGLRSNFVIYE